ncbi:MAG: class I SAM-dependent methyltransferase [Candidatus Hodarchaeota archaeon]
MKSSLLAGGKHYDLLVNWDRRLSSEIPFLLDFLKGIKPLVKTILEVGCGTGHHAQILQGDYGYLVTGVDIEESMIEEARKRVPEAEMLVHDFLDPKLLKGRSFDAIISLGNSVGLIASKSNFKAIISRFSQLLRKPMGTLIFHLLNTEKVRREWSSPRSVLTREGEYVFLRGFTSSEKYIHPEIITLYRPKNNVKWKMVTTGKANIPRISQGKMISLLSKYNFKNIKVFGDYLKNPFNPSNSVDMIFVCNS